MLNAYEFECHAGCKTKHPNNHIYFENGKTIYQITQELRSTPQSLLFETIQTVTGSPINQKAFQVWKGSHISIIPYCHSLSLSFVCVTIHWLFDTYDSYWTNFHDQNHFKLQLESSSGYMGRKNWICKFNGKEEYSVSVNKRQITYFSVRNVMKNICIICFGSCNLTVQTFMNKSVTYRIEIAMTASMFYFLFLRLHQQNLKFTCLIWFPIYIM